MDQSGTHLLESRLRLAEVMSGLCPDERVIFGPQKPQNWPKMANFDHFTSFDTQLTIFLTGTRWNSPKKFMIKVC